MDPQNIPPPRTVLANLDNLKPASQSPAALALAEARSQAGRTIDAPIVLAQTGTQGSEAQKDASEAASKDQPVVVAVGESARPKTRFEDLWNAILEAWLETPVLMASANKNSVPEPVFRPVTPVEAPVSRRQLDAVLNRMESVAFEWQKTWAGSLQAEANPGLQPDQPEKVPDAPGALRGRLGLLYRMHNL